ncbi:Vacuolar calcium ion transporter [Erysiphe necator]|uniref:Vacuolar calcium ion transporter n=1 Tax=Uncinula necator TaxID=52586 RepID=A0A0B1PED7_UNCNE|nr:Vacuolar calcium ion transporter [Erysiphe necator]KHJ35690.1 putative vacuolar h+-ca2+ exchanger [Erysiphe necator]
MVVGIHFRQTLRKAATNPRHIENNSNQPETMLSGENIGLLTGRTSNARKSAWRQIYDVLGSKHYSAGKDSDSKIVRAIAPTIQITKITLYSNYVNFLLIFVPLGIIGGYLSWNPSIVFFLNFLAVMPLAAVLSFATEEISMKVGETLGGLLNATFGNAVEMIISIVALKNGELRIVQSSMLGSILSNMLLVLGCCFLAGGIHNRRTGTAAGIEQSFNSTVASTMSSLMTVAAATLIIPATLYAALSTSSENTNNGIQFLSHGTAIILLTLYILYLTFQLSTHSSLFDAESQEQAHNFEAESDDTHMGAWPAAAVLIIVTVAVAICAEYLVDSIDSIVATAHISKTFIGLILLPIVGNAAEHATAIVVAVKDKMDLAMGVAIGSSLQIALLVTPSLVLLGWIIGQPLTLRFETFETMVFFLSVLVVTYVIQDGKSNYLEGAMLLGLYLIIALAFLVYPDDAGTTLPMTSSISKIANNLLGR